MAGPLSLDDAKQQLRVDGADDDALIESLIDAAIDQAERFTGLTLTAREVVEALPGFGARLSTWPVRDVTSITYRDGSGVEQQLAEGSWWVNSVARPLRLNPVTGGWPGVAAGATPITVTMLAGYEDGTVPAGIVQALKLMVTYFYECRDGAESCPAVAGLLRPHRLDLV